MKKKILYIHHGKMLGGAPVSLKNMIKGIMSETDSFEFTICCVYEEMIDFFKSIPDVTVKRYPGSLMFIGRVLSGHTRISFRNVSQFFSEILKLKESVEKEVDFFKEEVPDIIHLNSVILISCAVAAKKLNIPVVWHVREAASDAKLIRLIYSKYMNRYAAKIICIGSEEYKGIGMIGNKKAVIIHNSLDDSFFTFKDECLAKDNFRIITLGGNSYLKGTYQIIRSLKYLPERISLTIVGIPPVKNICEPGLYEKMVMKFEDVLFLLGLRKIISKYYDIRLFKELMEIKETRISMVGEQDDVKPHIAYSDVLVFAGTKSHSGRPVYEAWALKKPVVVFDSDVMRQDVENGIDGIIVKKHTAEGLAKAVKYIMENPEKAREMGEAGYKKAVERYSLEANSRKIIQIYSEILNESSI